MIHLRLWLARWLAGTDYVLMPVEDYQDWLRTVVSRGQLLRVIQASQLIAEPPVRFKETRH